jgi:phosphoglycolate phosphatase-like HAD superfamily hydrolase
MEFDLLIFDLDNTLLRTDSVAAFRGYEFVEAQPAAYHQQLQATAAAGVTPVYPQDFFQALRQSYPALKLAVFTRSPRPYVDTLLAAYYPLVRWDAVVAFGEVEHMKPEPDGILAIAEKVGVNDGERVVVIGDHKTDIQAAYRVGVWAVSEESTWTYPLPFDQQHVVERVPDGRVKGPDELLPFLNAPWDRVPLLEAWAHTPAGRDTMAPRRIDSLQHFDKSGVAKEDRRRGMWINWLGRRFRDDEADEYRRGWHPLTHEIEAHKDAAVFPAHWTSAIRQAIVDRAQYCRGRDAYVTVIPAKPGRVPRLEHLLGQLAQSVVAQPIFAPRTLHFADDVLAYREGVRSNHGEHLGIADRFINIRDHLFVRNPAWVEGKSFIVLDDVVTTGATLFYAHHYLMDNGAASVQSISFTKAVSTQ